MSNVFAILTSLFSGFMSISLYAVVFVLFFLGFKEKSMMFISGLCAIGLRIFTVFITMFNSFFYVILFRVLSIEAANIIVRMISFMVSFLNILSIAAVILFLFLYLRKKKKANQ